MNPVKLILAISVIASVSCGCRKDEPSDYHYSIPTAYSDGWPVCSSDSAGVSSSVLAQMMDNINETEGDNIHSILVFKDGNLVFEEYFEGYLYSSNPPGSDGDYIIYDRETDHYLASVSKSITSVIFGAAVMEGFIDDIDEKIINLLPEYQDILTGNKEDITVKHLLTMSSGLAWDESSTSYGNPANDVTALFNSDDPIEYILSRTLQSQPGASFHYNSGGTNVLGAIIQKYADMSLLDFGNQYLFDPLEIEGGIWQRIAGGYFFASGGIFLRPRELAKIGYLFLNNGYWGDHQVITEQWIDESITEHISTMGRTLPLAHAYGYQWWMMDFHANGITYNCFLAAGWGDQYMFIFPEQNMIVVFNCGNYLRYGSLSPFSLMEDYILAGL